MTETATLNPTATATGAFSAEQKEFLAGFMAGVAQRGIHPYVGTTATGQLTGDPAQGGANLAEETVYGTPLGDVTKQERWKHEEHPLDGWDRILAHAEAGKMPDEENTFRFRNFGMFYVAPAQNSFMLRCRIPAANSRRHRCAASRTSRTTTATASPPSPRARTSRFGKSRRRTW